MPKLIKRLFVVEILMGGIVLTGCGYHNASSPGAAEQTAGPLNFTDITAASGIRFQHNNGAFGAKLMPETMGSGVVFIDYDGDGYQDLFFVNSRDWTDAEFNAWKNGPGQQHTDLIPAHRMHHTSLCALYHNNGNGTFTDVTRGSGLDMPIYGMGATVGDYDNDGRPDLYVTCYGRNYLFHNEGGGKFKDVAAAAGVTSPGWSTSAAWLDYDKDGKLDLFVCHYIKWSPATDLYILDTVKLKAYGGPQRYLGEACRLYHNEGHGHFRDVSQQAGITQQIVPHGTKRETVKVVGKSLGVAICDYNSDRWPDIVVANDKVPNFFFKNNQNGTFQELGNAVDIAYSAIGSPRAGMGVDAADIDHTGRDSLVIGNFSDEMLALYQNTGDNTFNDVAGHSAVALSSLTALTFGCVFVDVNNDGWPDIFTANGHINQAVERFRKDVTYAQRPLLFLNQGRTHVEGTNSVNQQVATFKDITGQSGEALQKRLVGRGLAYADIDLDGDPDVVISTCGGSAVLLRNDGGNHNNAIRLILEGTKSNRSGIGAVVQAQVGPEVIARTLRSGSSYCSQSELAITLGLGQQSAASIVAILWPSGKMMRLNNVKANQIVTVNEDKGIVHQQAFPRR
ncbi:MAG: CRTAC1 family protein [Abitibacteriaceae bacterium]|nr:CRTAC1 family protein [Abditibacteriaceae bacterium]